MSVPNISIVCTLLIYLGKFTIFCSIVSSSVDDLQGVGKMAGNYAYTQSFSIILPFP